MPETNELGGVTARTNSYVELATGMHYRKGREWVESREEIEAFPGGAVARQGPHKVTFANNITTPGAIEMETPDGKRLRSHVLGLSYRDAVSGKSVLIAEVKDTQGKIVSPNQILYSDAFTDFKADMRYTYTLGGFEQDVILRERPPSPVEYGLNPETTRLEILTEFLPGPQPTKSGGPTRSPRGIESRDETLDFGDMKIGVGKAFDIERNRGGREILVNKQWMQLDGRDFLVEEVPVSEVTEELEALPTPDGASLEVPPDSVRHLVSNRRVVPSARPVVKAAGTNGMEVAMVTPPTRGLVLDYSTINGSLGPYTFQGDTTYYVSGIVNLSGTTTIEGGAVLKYAAGTKVNINGSLASQATSYRPAVFTAKDDNSIGENIAGSNGNPSGYYADPALAFLNSQPATWGLTNSVSPVRSKRSMRRPSPSRYPSTTGRL